VQEVMRRKRKTLLERAEGYKEAERAYRALAVALSSQGLGSIATRYRYRAEVMERKAFFWRGPKAPWIYPRWAISWLLGTFAGYGNYLSRLFITYAAVIFAFAAIFFVGTGWPDLALSPDRVLNMLALSVISFHGRGVQTQQFTSLPDVMLWLAGFEAVLGLLIEGLFVAAFTRRVTGN